MKWYSGGQERGEQAITGIQALLTELKNDSKSEALQTVLMTYQTEIERKESSVPLILSRMNVAVANTIRKEGLLLTDAQEAKLKALTALSNIRYGY